MIQGSARLVESEVALEDELLLSMHEKPWVW